MNRNGSETISEGDAEDLLWRLLVQHWHGGIGQVEAAKLIGINTADFAELSANRRILLMVQDVVWRYFLRAFYPVFPECDRSAALGLSAELQNASNRGGRIYSDMQLLSPPHLMTLKEAMRGNQNRANVVEWCIPKDSQLGKPKRAPRTVPIVEDDEYIFSGDEFDFTA